MKEIVTEGVKGEDEHEKEGRLRRERRKKRVSERGGE